MVRYWGLYNIVFQDNEVYRGLQGMPRDFNCIPCDERMKVGDFVYLFWADENLYVWGNIYQLGKPYFKNGSLYRDIKVTPNLLRSQLANVNTDIKSKPLFTNYDRLKQDGLSA